jgi:hypothetical protein
MKILLLSAGLIAGFQIGCGDDEDDTRQQSTDPGGDSDTDTDTNNNGTDTGTDTGATQLPACDTCLKASADGYIETTTNSWGIQGSWFTFDDGTSMIEGSVSANGGYCLKGTVKEADPPAWSIWGAGGGFTLCAIDETTEYIISECPLGTVSSVTGFRLTLTGNLGANGVRVTMTELGRDESAYIETTVVDQSVEYLFANASVAYDADAPAIDPTKVRALQFQVASMEGADIDFDFCIENIEPITQ